MLDPDLNVFNVFYDGSKNEVTVSAYDSSQDPTFFVRELVHCYILRNHEGDSVTLRKNKQTMEQAVILFATMLGLREAAKE
jgi:hypothetical protein